MTGRSRRRHHRLSVLVALCVALAAALAVVPVGTPPARASDPGCEPNLAFAPPTPYAPASCTGVRPGAFLAIWWTPTSGAGCTANFLFRGSAGERYLGTAGHCVVPGNTADTVMADGQRVEVDGQRVGQVAYGVQRDGRDFALVRLDPDVAASPEYMWFGGPTGLYADHSPTPVVLHHYGHGAYVSTAARARTGVAPNTSSRTQVVGESLVYSGDSGSGVLDGDGRAVGVAVTLGALDASDDFVWWFGTAGINRLDHLLPFAERALGTTLTLETAPFRSAR